MSKRSLAKVRRNRGKSSAVYSPGRRGSHTLSSRPGINHAFRQMWRERARRLSLLEAWKETFVAG